MPKSIPPRPKLGQLRSLQPSVLIAAPSAKSITIAAAGTVDSANPQLTHGQTWRPRLSPCAGPVALWVPPSTVTLDLLAFITQVLPVDFRMQTGPPREGWANARSDVFRRSDLRNASSSSRTGNISLHHVSFRYIVIFASAQQVRHPDRRK